MDIFMEKLIRRKRTTRDYLIVATVIYLSIMANFIALMVPLLRVFTLALAAVCIYFTVRRTYIEYEYSLTNNELDIDKIVAKKNRSRLFTASCKDFEMFGRIDHSKYNDVKTIEKKVLAVTKNDSKNVYFAVLQFEGTRTLLLFEPDERMIEHITACIPRKVFK
jgi:hypothetical protein